MPLFGYEGSFRAKSGREEELVGCLLRAAGAMGEVRDCLVYLVGKSPDDPCVVRVFEVWSNRQAHDNGLSLPEVRVLIADALPLLDSRPSGTSWEVVGGKGPI